MVMAPLLRLLCCFHRSLVRHIKPVASLAATGTLKPICPWATLLPLCIIIIIIIFFMDLLLAFSLLHSSSSFNFSLPSSQNYHYIYSFFFTQYWFVMFLHFITPLPPPLPFTQISEHTMQVFVMYIVLLNLITDFFSSCRYVSLLEFITP